MLPRSMFICVCCLLAAAATAQTPSKAGASQSVQVVVLEINGMRAKLRGADGREFWATISLAPTGTPTQGARLAPTAVGRSLRGTLRTAGDTVQVANAVVMGK